MEGIDQGIDWYSTANVFTVEPWVNKPLNKEELRITKDFPDPSNSNIDWKNLDTS